MKELEGVNGKGPVSACPKSAQQSGDCGKIVHFPAESMLCSAREDFVVEKINPYAFYQLGLELQSLSSVSLTDDKVSVREMFWPLFTARNALTRLRAGEPINLNFAKSAATTFSNAVNAMFAAHFLDEKGELKFPGDGETPTIWGFQWREITGALETFQTVFRTEMENATTYQVSKKGLYSTVELVESAEQIFPAELVPFVPQKVRDDFHAAGRCLAFNLPTAAGFHAARGIEGELELYWQTFTAKNGTRNGWQDYIDDLQKLIDKKANPAPEQRTVKQLEVVKTYDRNPVIHPRDAVLEELDARILFSSGESVVLAMAQEIREAKKGKSVVPVVSKEPDGQEAIAE